MGLDLQKLNAYRDAFLSLSSVTADQLPERRQWLVLAGDDAQNLSELVQSYVWDFGILEDEILSFKTWFALDYRAFGEILGRSPREVGQLLRQVRVAELETYPPVERAFESNQLGGLSCFMVEQHLSAWVDNELQDPSIKEQMEIHLTHCEPCAARLQVYRGLQSKILSARRVFPPLTDEEVSRIRERSKREERRALFKVASVMAIAASLAVVGVWIALSGHEKMPNVYEMGFE